MQQIKDLFAKRAKSRPEGASQLEFELRGAVPWLLVFFIFSISILDPQGHPQSYPHGYPRDDTIASKKIIFLQGFDVCSFVLKCDTQRALAWIHCKTFLMEMTKFEHKLAKNKISLVSF